MALTTNELYSENTRGPLIRVQPAEGPGALVVKLFKKGTAETLLAGTPLGLDPATGQWEKIVPNGSAHAIATAPTEICTGIVWPTDVTTTVAYEVLGTVMLKGQAHVNDISIALDDTAPDTNFLLCMRNPETRRNGLHIDGLTLAGGDV